MVDGWLLLVFCCWVVGCWLVGWVGLVWLVGCCCLGGWVGGVVSWWVGLVGW